MKYLKEVQFGMDYLADDAKTIFVGQAMQFKGHAVSRQVEKYPKEKLLEFPVAEELQAGFCLGLALTEYIPVCIYPRWNFALLGANQIVNHIDKWPLLMASKQPSHHLPKVIIKVVVGSERPLNPGWQHRQNFTAAFKSICETIEVFDLQEPEQVFPAYNTALNRTDGRSSLIVEYGDYYHEK